MGSNKTIFIACFAAGGHHLSYLRSILAHDSYDNCSIIVICSNESEIRFKSLYPIQALNAKLFIATHFPDRYYSSTTSTSVGRFLIAYYEAKSIISAISAYNPSIRSPNLLLIGGDVFLPYLPLFFPSSAKTSLVLIRPPLPIKCAPSIFQLTKLILYSLVLRYDLKINNIFLLKTAQASATFIRFLRDKIKLVPDPVYIPLTNSILDVSRDILNAFELLSSSNTDIILLFYGAIGARKNTHLILNTLAKRLDISRIAIVLAGNIEASYLDLVCSLTHKLSLLGCQVYVFNRYINDPTQHFLFSNSTHSLVFNADASISSGVLHLGLAYGLEIYTSENMARTHFLEERNNIHICTLEDLSTVRLQPKDCHTVPYRSRNTNTASVFSEIILRSVMADDS